jgi:glycosyltransferase involved in cell wall biosynthesis
MRYLFVHQNFPAQFLHLLRRLAPQNAHELLFLTENTTARMSGVRKMVHKLPQPATPGVHQDAREFEISTIRAQGVADGGRQLKALGFEPEIIIGHHGWGELLNVRDVWPDAPLLGYYEFYYNVRGFDVGFDPEFATGPLDHPRVRAKNTVNLLALDNPGHGFTPTQFQLSTYPAWAQKKITVLPEGVNLDVCKPDPSLRKREVTIAGYRISPHEKLITYVVRDLEPYRGFHVFMRALPHILAARPDARVILVGGDGVSYGARPAKGTWRERMLQELSGKLDISRVHFAGRVTYDTYVKLLQRSDAHVYLTYPFVASWSLRESLAMGCAVVASDTAPVHEFVTHEKNGLLVPFLDPAGIADGVLRVLADTRLANRLRRAARAWAEEHLQMDAYLDAFEALIAKVRAGDV